MRVMLITLSGCYGGFEVRRPSTSGLLLIAQENSEDHSELCTVELLVSVLVKSIYSLQLVVLRRVQDAHASQAV